jgi:hypothetical protein
MNNPPGLTSYEQHLSSQPVRALQAWEQMVLSALISAAGLPVQLADRDALDGYRVREMLDGGMGSLRFVSNGDRRGGKFSVAELWYIDSDGILISFALNLDDRGEPWEMDAWKVNGSPLQQPPLASDLRSTADR